MGYPFFPGVPPLLNPPDQVPDFSALSADDPSVSQVASVQWGLYKDGQPVVIADSVTAMGFRATSNLPTYQQEQGAFQNYDKVQLPFAGRFRFATGGSLSDRTAFLNSIDTLKKSLTLVDMVIPETTYSSVNVSDYDYDRKNASGLGILFVDVACEEIRVTGAAAFSNTTTASSATPVSNTKTPSGASQVVDGTVQTVTVTPAVRSTVSTTVANGGGGW